MKEPKPRILCVDDEENVLRGLRVLLRRKFDVAIETDPRRALVRVVDEGPFAVVVADMRMPGMNGAQLLSHIRDASPDVVRMLLTGYAEMDTAIAAINEGQIFRFLTKPCAPTTLRDACTAAARQHKLLSAERELLERTLRGAVKTLCETMSLLSPLAFGRANRIERIGSAIARALDAEPWLVEVSAVLSQLGHATLPESLLDKCHHGQALTAGEAERVRELPPLVDKLLASIPRLERVRAVIRAFLTEGQQPVVDDEAAARAAAILCVALDYDTLRSTGLEARAATERLASAPFDHAPDLLNTLETIECGASAARLHRVPLHGLNEGMVLARDLLTSKGTLLLTRGQGLTETLIDRLGCFRSGEIVEPILVLSSTLVPTAAAQSA